MSTVLEGELIGQEHLPNHGEEIKLGYIVIDLICLLLLCVHVSYADRVINQSLVAPSLVKYGQYLVKFHGYHHYC